MKLLDPSKLSVPAVLVISLLSVTAGAVGSFTMEKIKVDETAKALEETKIEIAKTKEDVRAIELAHAGDRADVQARLQNIEHALDRIERWAGTK